MVLNELNNLKINGHRIEDIEVKKEIYEKAFLGGEIIGNITLKNLKKWMIENSIIDSSDDLGGSSETKFLPKISTHRDFIKCLGPDYAEKYSNENLERIVEIITILGQEKKMLKKKLQELLECTEEQANRLSKLNYKDWAKFSRKLLTGIKANVNGLESNIIDALYNTNNNLMELLGGEFEFKNKIDEFNDSKEEKNTKITYKDVNNLYCSPAVKRTVWQAIKIVNELVKVKKCAPEKIFLEVTRGEDKNNNGSYTLSRHKQLHDLYKQIKNNPEVDELLKKLDSKEPRDLQNKKLYLYFTQMGRCAYTGEPIDFESLMTRAYDIDHIYPRSLTKDDSITKNLVLVKAEYNREKTNEYPIKSDWRQKMIGTWNSWARNGLITKEKYERLTRGNPLTADELGNFIARQIVETSQSVKAIRDLLKKAYPETKIVMVKANQVSDFRKWFGYDRKNKEGQIVYDGKPEFIKVRAINDFHHAKDAYLNIVVGNVMSESFTDNPFKWVKNREGKEYSLNSWVLWNEEGKYSWIKGWNGAETIKTVSDQLKRNDCLWTRMEHIYADKGGVLSKQSILGKGDDTDGILSIKEAIDGGKYDPKKYGGYTSIYGAYFSLIEFYKKDERHIALVQIPTLRKDNPEGFVTSNYKDAKILRERIYTNSLLRMNNDFIRIAGRSKGTIILAPAKQLYFRPRTEAYLKRVEKIVSKMKLDKKYEINVEYDKINAELNLEVYDKILEKIKIDEKLPGLGHRVEQLKDARLNFVELSLSEQCQLLINIITAFSCNTTVSSFADIMSGAGSVGKASINNDLTDIINDSDIFQLINQSVTGLYEKEIDLKTV